MKINIHAGHNADGNVACGAVGVIKESTEARKVKEEVIRQLKALGNTVYDCTVDNAIDEASNLSEIVRKCNVNAVDLDVSIHFNAGAKDKKGNGKTCGTEIWIYNNESKAKSYAKKVIEEIEKLGFTNRGIKNSTGLYVLKHTKAPGMLIECCFVDDKDDCEIYNAKKMANAIVKGITGKNAPAKEKTDIKKVYHVQVGAYSKKENAQAMADKLKKLGFDCIIV
ncbi:MAG: N-acetylmuramoyl-L-alanine amidase [Eubacteriales bacterium]|nr:N-acetylmuramoyl-L-alanine amidase [Eubacteriales bacterium]